MRKLILPDTPIPMNWGNFFRLDKNNDELFRLLALEIQGMDTGQKAIISTLHETIITSNDEILWRATGVLQVLSDTYI